MKHKEPAKFNFQIKKTSGPENHIIHTLEKWRVLFHKMKLIGKSPIDEVSYGELSRRESNPELSFIITGEQTGHMANLKREHYAKVMDCDVKKMKIAVEGAVAPPENFLYHYAIYNALDNVKFIFHIHQPTMRRALFKSHQMVQVDTEDMRPNEIIKEFKSDLVEQIHNIVLVKELPDSVFILGDNESQTGKLVLELNKKHQPKISDN